MPGDKPLALRRLRELSLGRRCSSLGRWGCGSGRERCALLGHRALPHERRDLCRRRRDRLPCDRRRRHWRWASRRQRASADLGLWVQWLLLLRGRRLTVLLGLGPQLLERWALLRDRGWRLRGHRRRG